MTACRWVDSTSPRVVPGRHVVDAYPHGANCEGCLPCPERHCRVCNHTHADGTCPECMAETRGNLREIGRLCDALPEEVAHRGVESEALMLLGPVADPEARQHVEAAYLSGRLPEGWIEAAHGRDCPLLTNDACAGCAGGELHPLTLLGTWHMLVTAELEHDEGEARITVSSATEYLDRQLTYLGGYDLLPFEDFARDLRRCVAHLEAVLHDGEQRDTGAPCMTCGGTLSQPMAERNDCRHSTSARKWLAILATYPELPTRATERRAAREACEACNQGGRSDTWECPRCRQTSTEDQYRFAVAHLHREEATHLTDRDMEIRTGVKAGTVRVWGLRGHVQRRRESGRTVYCVADVERHAKLGVAR